MSFAYLPLYTGDYLRDTQHLSCSEHGIYLKFLMHCWDQKGPVPLDERKQQGICNARSGDEIEAMRRIRGEFFIKMEDGWYNGRMQAEIERAESISKARSEAGTLGYEARAKQLLGKRKANAKQVHLPTTTTSTTPASNHKSEAQAVSPSGIPATEPVISIPLNDNSEYPIPRTTFEEWVKLYPDCDVMQTLREIRGWNMSNPQRRKTKTGILNHVNRWLAKEQNRG
jgi:uncharacterized protein YdaU (DUF1376 family)